MPEAFLCESPQALSVLVSSGMGKPFVLAKRTKRDGKAVPERLSALCGAIRAALGNWGISEVMTSRSSGWKNWVILLRASGVAQPKFSDRCTDITWWVISMAHRLKRAPLRG